MNDLETKRRWKSSTLRISTLWSELREVLSLWLFHANCLSLVLVVPLWSRLFFWNSPWLFSFLLASFCFDVTPQPKNIKEKLNDLILFFSFSFPFFTLCLEKMLSTIRLVLSFFFLHFKFLSWHSSCPFQVSRDSSLITHGSSLMAHHSSLITDHSSLITDHSTLITHVFHSSWLLVPFLTPGSPPDSWLLFYLILIYEGICSFVFCYLEKPRGNSDRPFFIFWQKTWGTPDRPSFTFWQKTFRNFDPPFYISLNKVKLFTAQICSSILFETVRDLLNNTLY